MIQKDGKNFVKIGLWDQVLKNPGKSTKSLSLIIAKNHILAKKDQNRLILTGGICGVII